MNLKVTHAQLGDLLTLAWLAGNGTRTAIDEVRLKADVREILGGLDVQPDDTSTHAADAFAMMAVAFRKDRD